MFTRTGASTSPFGGAAKPNPFGGTGTTATQPQNPFGALGMGSAESSNIMYLSSNNPNRHSKLSTFPENIKKGFYFIENKFENNDRYLEAFSKGKKTTWPTYNLYLAHSTEDMIELKNQTAEAVKSVKSAWNALNNINIQVRMLQLELESNHNVVDEMKFVLDKIKKGSDDISIPSTFFVSLLGQFESRLSQYKKRIDEMEEIINSSLEKENQKQRLMQEGSAAVDDPMGYDDSQGVSTNSSLLYQVLHLLYSNFCVVANQVEAVNEMVENKEAKMKKFLEKNSSLSQGEIEKLFKYKESESESMMKNSDWSTLMAFDKFSLDEKKEDERRLGKKRKAYETLLIQGEDGMF